MPSAAATKSTIAPPVNVNQGDLIGVVQLLPVATCGSVQTQSFAEQSTGYNLVTTADMSTTAGTIGRSSNRRAGSPSAPSRSTAIRCWCVLAAAGTVQARPRSSEPRCRC